MASIKAEVAPLTVPSHVSVKVGKKQYTELDIKELSEDVLAELAEEFTKNLFEAAGKKL